MYPKLFSNSLCSQGWPWISDSPAFIFWVLILKTFVTTSGLLSFENQTQGYINSKQELYQVSYACAPNLKREFQKLESYTLHRKL